MCYKDGSFAIYDLEDHTKLDYNSYTYTVKNSRNFIKIQNLEKFQKKLGEFQKIANLEKFKENYKSREISEIPNLWKNEIWKMGLNFWKIPRFWSNFEKWVWIFEKSYLSTENGQNEGISDFRLWNFLENRRIAFFTLSGHRKSIIAIAQIENRSRPNRKFGKLLKKFQKFVKFHKNLRNFLKFQKLVFSKIFPIFPLKISIFGKWDFRENPKSGFEARISKIQ